MERINDTHRSYPRTLQEALGPYASGPLHPMPTRRNRLAIPAYVAGIIIFIIIIILALL
jgi:hypothetical protein